MIMDIIRNWHPFWQFSFFVIFVGTTSAAATSMTQSISTAICKYFMYFLTIILRGWPEGAKVELDNSIKESDNDEEDTDATKNS